MTCNPKWKEIVGLDNISDTWNKFYLICDVFELKKNEFIKDIKERKIFGEIISYVFVIEYQGRGLPHMHFVGMYFFI